MPIFCRGIPRGRGIPRAGWLLCCWLLAGLTVGIFAQSRRGVALRRQPFADVGARGHWAPCRKGSDTPRSPPALSRPPMRDTPPPWHAAADRQEPAASARPQRACRRRLVRHEQAARWRRGRAAMRRGDDQCPGRDGCRRARALGAGGLERAV